MTSLIKPSRREILKTAARHVTESIEARRAEMRKEAAALEREANEILREAARKKIGNAVEKMQAQCNSANRALKRAKINGHFEVKVAISDRRFEYEGQKRVRRDAHANAYIEFKQDNKDYFNQNHVTVRETKKVTALEKRAAEISEQADSLAKKEFGLSWHATDVQPEHVVDAAINQNLNGDAAAAMDRLVEELGKIDLSKLEVK